VEGQESTRRTQEVSGNYRFYSEKMAEIRARRAANRPLQNQLEWLLLVVWKCEAQWK
jgi:G:T-mismatch repair DNA endonuclease (very short patch repair protein)